MWLCDAKDRLKMLSTRAWQDVSARFQSWNHSDPAELQQYNKQVLSLGGRNLGAGPGFTSGAIFTVWVSWEREIKRQMVGRDWHKYTA